MYEVIFEDKVHGAIDEKFDTFAEAMDFWNDYADTSSCTAGELSDTETGEVIWTFDTKEG